jgi:hypothetical protein
MKHISSEVERDKKLAAAAFLRDSDGQNKERLLHVNNILTGQPISIKEYTSDTPQKTAYNDEEKAFWRSFRNRCIASLLLAAGIYLATMSNSPEITPYINKIKAEIGSDYSENLFDFIEQIPYTLDYEKINA